MLWRMQSLRACSGFVVVSLLGATVFGACGTRRGHVSHVESPGDHPLAPAGVTTAPEGAGGDPLDHAREVCLAEINKYRASINVKPLQRWRAIELCTDNEAHSDSQTGQPHSAFGTCQEGEQCECPGWDGAPETAIVGCLKMMWDEGPGGGHHDAMADPTNAIVSCGFYQMGDGGLWAVQNYSP